MFTLVLVSLTGFIKAKHFWELFRNYFQTLCDFLRLLP